MPAKDIYHDAVKNALIKDGWLIIADPYIIKYEDAELYADLAAEKPIAAERQVAIPLLQNSKFKIQKKTIGGFKPPPSC